MFSRKTTFVIPFFLLGMFAEAAVAQEIKVTLLGTGNPPPVMNRFGPSILVEAGDKKLLFKRAAALYGAWHKLKSDRKT